MKINVKTFNELSLNELYEILKLRAQVFIVNQQSIYQDLDSQDQMSIHIYLNKNSEIIAYLRLIPINNNTNIIRLGRFIAKYERKGYGSILMEQTINYVANVLNTKEILIEAQVQAIPFYEKFGFIAISNPYILDEIPHIEMILKI